MCSTESPLPPSLARRNRVANRVSTFQLQSNQLIYLINMNQRSYARRCTKSFYISIVYGLQPCNASRCILLCERMSEETGC